MSNKGEITTAINLLLDSIVKDSKYYPQIAANFSIGDISDGYHTFDELYRFRLLYNALLFNVLSKNSEYGIHKSWRHSDGEKCFGRDDYFVVVAMLPTGLITNHYPKEDWDLFKIPELYKSSFAYDGHTSTDVAERLINFIKQS